MAAVGSLGSTNSESAARSAAGSVTERAMNGDTASPTTGTWSASSKSRIARNSAAIRMIPARESSGIVMNVPVSARSTASARAFGPRTAITTGVWKSDASLTEAGNLGGVSLSRLTRKGWPKPSFTTLVRQQFSSAAWRLESNYLKSKSAFNPGRCRNRHSHHVLDPRWTAADRAGLDRLWRDFELDTTSHLCWPRVRRGQARIGFALRWASALDLMGGHTAIALL